MSTIEIHTGDLDRPYQVIGPIRARVGAGSIFSNARTLEHAESKLREEALKVGANAVIGVSYKRGISPGSWKALTAIGTAVIAESDERACPFCAESVKRIAIVCRHCGRDLPPAPPQEQPKLPPRLASDADVASPSFESFAPPPLIPNYWWILAAVFGWIGGTIGWLLHRKSNAADAKKLLVLGWGMTVLLWLLTNLFG